VVTLRARALLLDFDGVLVDSTAAVERAWTLWADERGLDRAHILAHAHGRRSADVIRLVAPDMDVEVEAALLEDREVDSASTVRAFEGAAALLAGLPPRKWAIVTSGTRKLATARLRATGLPIPDALITADDVTKGKPEPDPYLLAARTLGVAPEDCVVIEDAPAGAEAARRAGMRAIAVISSHAPEEFDEPTAMVAKLTAITVATDDDELQITVEPLDRQV
jgi:mannitol-1-/sugar-/sorbitol-6-phosphatase